MPRVLMKDNSIEETTREDAVSLIREGAAKGIVTSEGVKIPPEAEAEKIGEEPTETKRKEPREPLWSKRIPVSQQRNLNVVVWPGSGNRGPSIALEESRKQGSEWNTSRIYLPLAKSTELAERIKQAVFFVRDREE